MARGWYGTPKTWQEAARRTGALLAMGETRAARVSRNYAQKLWREDQEMEEALGANQPFIRALADR